MVKIGETWIGNEQAAYCTPTGTHWGSRRRGLVRFPDGKLRRVTLGIPDTWFSIPGHDSRGRVGFVTSDEDGFAWHPRAERTAS